MATGVITKRAVDAAKPSERDLFLWDTEVSGFGLKVTPSGGKVYIYQYRIGGRDSPTRRYTIGKHGALTPEQARTRAKALAHMAEQKIDPRQAEADVAEAAKNAKLMAERVVKLESELAFEKVANNWLEHYEHEKGRRPASVALARLVLKRYLVPALTGVPMPHVGRAELQPILDGIPLTKKGMRRAVFAYASVLFGWAHKRGHITQNPLTAMVKPEAPKARDRVLADEELARLWEATSSIAQPFGSFFRILILTGQRRSEVAGMGWIELNRAAAAWTIPAARAKNGATHIVPLCKEIIEELDALSLASQVKAAASCPDGKCWPETGFVLTTTGRTGISGITKAKAALDAKTAEARGGAHLTPWRIHDLRRTMATGLQRLGVRFEVTEAVLNHVSGAKGGVAGIYQRHDWADEKRSALDAWARHVIILGSQSSDDNVISFDAIKKAT
jgi:integrase